MTLSVRYIDSMRPDISEIIIFSGLRSRGRQAWASVATGLFCDRKQRG